MPDEFEWHAPQFLALARQIFDAGAKAERERLMALLQTPREEVSAPAQVPRKRRKRSAGYGSVSGPVREALNELSADSPGGVTTADLAAHFELRGTGPTGQQIRAALKQLTKSGEAVNVALGKYLSRGANESRRAEKPGDDAPGSFNLRESMAAE